MFIFLVCVPPSSPLECKLQEYGYLCFAHECIMRATGKYFNTRLYIFTQLTLTYCYYFKVHGIFWNLDVLLSMFCIGVIPVYTPKRSQWIHFSKSSIEENSGLTYITVVKWYFISKLFYNFTLVRDWVKVAQLCLTLCDPMNYIVHGILQARKLECVAILYSSGPSQPSDPTQISHIAGRFFTGWAIREDSEIEHYLYFSSKKFIFLSQKKLYNYKLCIIFYVNISIFLVSLQYICAH